MHHILSEVKKTPKPIEKPLTSSVDAGKEKEESAPQITGFITLPIEPFLKYIPKTLFQQKTPENQDKLTRLFLKMAELYKKYLDKKRAQERG